MRSTPPGARVRVAFVDQMGKTAGGAERNLAVFLAHLPPTIDPLVILFEDGGFADELRILGVPVNVVPMSSALSSASRDTGRLRAAFAALIAVIRVWRILRRHRVDLTYTNSMKAHLIGGIAAWLAGKRNLFHFHDLYDGFALRALRLVARLCSDERIACSKLVADAIGIGSTTVIYAPVDLAAFAKLPSRETALRKLGIAGDLPLVGLVGRINRWKGHDRFVRIAARVNDRIAARFVIVGSPIFRDIDFVPELHAMAEKTGLDDRIAFVSWHEDVRDVFAAISINANCSTREPFGRSIPEAAAAGVPSVCFTDSGAAETMVDGVTGRTVAAGDEAAFADAIVQYLQESERLEAASLQARSFVSDFDAVAISAKTSNVILRAARGRRKPAASSGDGTSFVSRLPRKAPRGRVRSS